MRRGAIRRRVDPVFHSTPDYGVLLVGLYKQTHAISDFAEFIDSGRPLTARLSENGIPAYEVGHIEQGKFKPTDILVNPNSDRILKRHDILTGRVGGLGCFAEYKKNTPASFSDNTLRIRPKTSQKSRAAFIEAFLNSTIGNTQLLRDSRGGLQKVVTQKSLGSVIVPSIGASESRLVAELDAARAERDRALAEAERLTVTFNDYLLNELELTMPDENTQKAFSVRLDAVRGSRIDPSFHQPILARGAPPKVPIKALSELAIVNGNSIEKPDDIETLVPYVGLPECDQTEVREVAMRPYREVRGRNVVRLGDILFARIEPSIFNKKYVLVDDLKGHEYAYTSTEFYVVSHRPGISVTEYIYAMLFCSFVYAQTQGKTTGSSGKRRLAPDHFRLLKIPAPELSMQQSIATEAIRRREESRRLRTKAETIWREARERFEQQLLQGGTP